MDGPPLPLHQHAISCCRGGGGRAIHKGGSGEGRDRREALGQSRGGFGTKVVVMADGRGRALAFQLAPGQAHELPHTEPLLVQLPHCPRWIVADRGYGA